MELEPVSLVKEISQLMSAHELVFHVENEWVVPNGTLPAIRTIWYPQENNGRLNVDILLEDKRVITECFAGLGSGVEGIKDALQNFCVN